jgi:hypothetical protein
MKRFLLLLAFLSFSSLSYGAEKSAWQGPGTVSCAEFGKACQRSPENETLFFSWALGFMSGLNTDLLPNRATDLHGLPMETQKEAIRTYCHAHPRAPRISKPYSSCSTACGTTRACRIISAHGTSRQKVSSAIASPTGNEP